MSTRNLDGGWPPTIGVDQSTWVTSLAILLLADLDTLDSSDPALRWALRQTGRESGTLFRVRRWLIGGDSDDENQHDGWPWFPRASAWVTPTAITILALRKAAGKLKTRAFDRRIDDGRKFLIARACIDGGWNHGSSRALGYEGHSYPETTGLALLALEGVSWPGLERAMGCAEGHLLRTRSSQAVSWLRMALLAHGRHPAEKASPCRDSVDLALRCIEGVAANGRNVFTTSA